MVAKLVGVAHLHFDSAFCSVKRCEGFQISRAVFRGKCVHCGIYPQPCRSFDVECMRLGLQKLDFSLSEIGPHSAQIDHIRQEGVRPN